MTNFITKQKLLVLLLLVVFLAVVSQVISFLTAPQKTSTNPQLIPTPTIIAAPLPQDLTNTTILTTPAQIENVSILATVSATFPRAIKDNEKASVTITISPSVDGSTSWSADNKTISFVQTKALATSQHYTATILYFDKQLTWSFTTVAQDNLNQQEQNQLQIQADDNWGNWQENLYQNYPWYDLLPIQSNSYFVYFDTNSKKFIATIYVTSSDSQAEKLKNDIISRFHALNIPTSTYPIVWEYNPNPGSE